MSDGDIEVKKSKLDKYIRRAVKKGLPEDLIMQKMVKAGFSEIDIHQSVNRAEAEIKDKVNHKKLRWLYLIPVLIPLIIIGYVVYMNWLPLGYEKSYFLDVGGKKDIDKNEKVYLRDLTAEGRLSERMFNGNINYREIKKSPIYVYFKPDIIIKNDTKVVFQANIKSSMAINITSTDYMAHMWKDFYIPKEGNQWSMAKTEFKGEEIKHPKGDKNIIVFVLHNNELNNQNITYLLDSVKIKVAV